MERSGTTVRRLRRTILILAVLLSACLLAESASALARTAVTLHYSPISYYFGDESFAPPEDQQGFLYNNRIYLPLRFVAHSLNQAVSWDAENRTVTIRTPTRREQAAIDAYNEENRTRAIQAGQARETSGDRSAVRSASVLFIKVTYVFYGEQVETPDGMEAIMINNRLYVPLRLVATLMGFPVTWDQADKSVRVNLPPAFETDDSPSLVDVKRETAAPDHDRAVENGNKGGREGSTAVPPSGGGFGPSPSGGKPSYEELKRQTENRLANLKAECESRMYALLNQYDPSLGKDAINHLLKQGEEELAWCDAQFESIMQDLAGKLAENGYPTDVIDEYRNQYKAIKDEARKRVGL